jgi:hypothetical protein
LDLTPRPDSFGVLNFLTLYKETSDSHYIDLARSLVGAVHDTLGRTRDGKSRLPGASDSAPLAGGLRIGKDSATGPDGDGQYHHYLTLWMFALNRLSLACNDHTYNDLGISLAKAIHPRFVYNRDSSRPRMFWKMSMDLSQPLVRSEGNLDPIDGFVTFRLLQEADGQGSTVLEEEIADYEKIVRAKWRGYSSADPLDLGMTLWTAHWFAGEPYREEWAEGLVQRAKRDLAELFEEGYFDMPMKRRLAFRECGTCLGIGAATEGEDWSERREKITQAWEETGVVPDPDLERDGAAGSNAMADLQPITLVMYAAALNPGGKFGKLLAITPEFGRFCFGRTIPWSALSAELYGTPFCLN